MKRTFALMLFAAFVSLPALGAVPKKLNAFSEGDRMVYTRLVEAYRKNDLTSVQSHRRTLEKNYPQSIHLDNAYYLTGMLEYQNQFLGEAVRSFNTVTDRFPKSNKRPAALFGLAMSYKRLNLGNEAHRVFNRIAREYPGSPESQRAWMHLQLEKGRTKKR
jgi:TolA-binding protein